MKNKPKIVPLPAKELRKRLLLTPKQEAAVKAALENGSVRFTPQGYLVKSGPFRDQTERAVKNAKDELRALTERLRRLEFEMRAPRRVGKKPPLPIKAGRCTIGEGRSLHKDPKCPRCAGHGYVAECLCRRDAYYGTLPDDDCKLCGGTGYRPVAISK